MLILPQHRGFKRKTRHLLTQKAKPGLSRLMYDHEVGQKVVIDIDPTQPKGMPFRRYQGKVGTIIEVRPRSVLLEVPIGEKTKRIIARLEHVKRLKG